MDTLLYKEKSIKNKYLTQISSTYISKKLSKSSYGIHYSSLSIH